MSSKAKLPDDDAQALLDRVLDLLDDAAGDLAELEQDERWRIWNLGGAAEGHPEFRGPGHYTAREFTAMADHLRGRLRKVSESFEHRKAKEAERRERRQDRRQAEFDEREARRQHGGI
jgi:hypothetical protein